MISVRFTNSLLHIDAPPDIVRRLDTITSYPIEGAEHVKAFRAGFWDGKEHLLRRSKREPNYVLPTGLWPDIQELLVKAELTDARRPLGPSIATEWIGKPHRDYQLESVEAALRERGLATGRGLVNVPIRGGKTHIASLIIHKLGLRTLFLVPSDMLLFQTVDAIKSNLNPAPVGMFGAGRWEPSWIIVATIQSMLAQPERAAELLGVSDVLFVDEAHHLEAPAWRQLVLRSDARFKFGLSATILVSRERPSELSSIWLKACTGPIVYKTSMKRLMDAGYLMRPKILIYPLTHPTGETFGWQKAYKHLLARSPIRTGAIVDLTAESVSRGLRVLIDTGRIDQMNNLYSELLSRGLSVEKVYGKTPPEVRWEIVRRFQRREVQVIIGTVFGEGVDIPELEVVINAEGQQSRKATIQRMRNLTPCEGKGQVLFIDFADKTNKYLRKHALERVKTYRAIRGFSVKLMPDYSDGKFSLPSEL